MFSFIKLKSLIPFFLLCIIMSAGCTSPKKQKNITKSPLPKVEDTKKTEAKEEIYLVNVGVADVHAEANDESELLTQSLLADPIKILDKSNNKWYKVQVPDGYTGYINKDFIIKVNNDSIYHANGKVVIVNATNVPLVEAIKSETEVARAFLGTQLALVKQEDKWLEVELPDNRKGWLKTENAMVIPKRDNAPQGSPDKVIGIANKYLGTPYLWGGVTPQGVDCSGLAYFAYLLNGVKLPRDADIQFKSGDPIENISDLKKGDLVFFATVVPKPDITHVGIYISEGKFIHAANKKQGTIISGINESKYSSTFKGGRRYLK